MFVHTVIMVIEPHMKQGRQHKLISTIFLATSVTKKLDHNTCQFLWLFHMLSPLYLLDFYQYLIMLSRLLGSGMEQVLQGFEE